MGAEAAVNAVYANKIAAIADEDERAAFVAAKRAEYEQDIDIVRLASELVVDAIVEPARPARRADPPVRAPRAARTGTSPAAGTASPRSDSTTERPSRRHERRADRHGG